jgi:hypothetical protein
MLAAGTCQDGNLCGGAYSQCQRNTINNVNQGIAKAVSSKYFSTAYKVFAQGTHTVLLRHNNYMGCGGAFTDCLASGPIVFKVETGLYLQPPNFASSALATLALRRQPGLKQHRCRGYHAEYLFTSLNLTFKVKTCP